MALTRRDFMRAAALAGAASAGRDYDKKTADGNWDVNSVPVDQRLFQNLLNENENFLMGKVYDEKLAVHNSGNIDQYVRVNIYRYWVKVKEDEF